MEGSMREWCLFLRLGGYCAADVPVAKMEKAQEYLPGVTRLAHKWDVPRLLATLETHFLGSTSSDSEQGFKGLLVWLQLAEELSMTRLLADVVGKAARYFKNSGAPWLDALPLHNVVGPSTLSLLLAALATEEPAVATLESWAALRGHSFGMMWRVPYSADRTCTVSPILEVGGLSFKLRFKTHVSSRRPNTHVGIFIEVLSSPSLPAATKVRVVAQVTVVSATQYMRGLFADPLTCVFLTPLGAGLSSAASVS
jgi:hypothetical protein